MDVELYVPISNFPLEELVTKMKIIDPLKRKFKQTLLLCDRNSHALMPKGNNWHLESRCQDKFRTVYPLFMLKYFSSHKTKIIFGKLFYSFLKNYFT